jgi:hypothetical protein
LWRARIRILPPTTSFFIDSFNDLQDPSMNMP